MMKTLRVLLTAAFASLLIGSNSLMAQITIGTGTSSTTNTPIFSCYGYTYSEQIYLQSEIGASGTITSISFYVNSLPSSTADSDDWTIYLGHTSQSSYATDSSWIKSGNLTQVYSDSVVFPSSGWMTINLTTPFAYNNIDNLVVAVDENRPGYNCSVNWAYTTAGANSSIYYRSDSFNPDPATPPSAYSRTANRANLQLGGLSQACPPPTNVTVPSLTSTTATVQWTTGGAMNWMVQYDTAGFSPGTGNFMSASSSSVTLSNLTANTFYDVYVKDSCSASSTSVWVGPINFYTGYCIPAPSSVDNDGITNVSMGTINNATVAESGNYGDYSNLQTNVAQGGFIPVDITYSTGYTYGTKIWVDWNDDLDFNDTLELVYTGLSTSSNPTTLNASFLVPSNATLGNHRLRIGGTDNNSGPSSPCYTGSYGCFEDYSVNVTLPPSCTPSIFLGATSVTNSSAMVYWNSSSGATTFLVEYDTTGFTPGNGMTMSVTNDTAMISGLVANTAYDFYVVDSCASGLSAAAGPSMFTTLANPVVVPYSEDFNGLNPLADFQLTDGGNSAIDTASAASCNGSRGILFTGGTSSGFTGSSSSTTPAQAWGNTTHITSADIFVDATSATNFLKVDFSLKQEYSYGSGYSWFRVLVNGTQVSPNYQPTTATGDACITQSVDLMAYAGTMFTLTFQASCKYAIGTGTQNGDNAYLDNVLIYAPNCNSPSNLGATNILATTADIYFTGGGASHFNIEYGVSGFVQGAGMMVSSANDTVSVASLSPQTTYEFYVRDSCGVGNVSNWVGPMSFTTACAAVATFPWTEDFETSQSVIPLCWTNETNDDSDWIFRSGSIGHGASVDHTLGTSSGYYAGVDDSHSSVNDTVNTLLLPTFDLSNLTNPELEFYYYIGNDNVLTSTLYIDVYNGSTWMSSVAQIEFTQAAWLTYTIDLTSYKSSSTQIRFRVHETTDYNSDITIDDVTVQEAPMCAAPTLLGATNIAAITADIFWTEGGAANFNVEYGMAGFTPGAGMMMNAANDTVGLSSLIANTAYEFYVRDSCGVGNVSAWTGPFAFTTLCNPFTAPYTESFDTTVIPGCWSQTAVSGGPWLFSGSTNSVNCNAATDHTGNGGSYTWMDQSGSDAGVSLIMGAVDVSTLTVPYLEFYYWMCGAGYSPPNLTFVEAWNGNSWSVIDSISTATVGWQKFGYTLTSYTYGSNLVKIRFRAESGGSGSDYYGDNALDDITIKETPSCLEPTALGGMVTSATTATVYWSSSASSFQFQYDTTGFMPGTGTLTLMSNDTASLTNLAGNTNYDFYVRSICAPGDTSTWAGPFSFFTGYCTPAPSSVDNQGITNVTMGGINNTTVAEPGNYGDYTSLVANGTQGATLPIDVTLATGYTYDLWVWIDWNDDLDFNDPNEEYYLGTSTNSNPTTFNGSIAIPTTASVGHHRFRLGGADNGLGSTPPSDPCYTGSYGAFEDYTLNITPALDSFDLLSPPNMATRVVAGPAQNQVVASWQPASANATYEWRLFLPGGSVNAPVVALPSDNGGMDTTLTLTIGQLDALLASLNVNIGDTATIEWSVKAMESGDSLFANMPFTLNLVRLGTSTPNVVAAPVGGTGTTGLSAPNGTSASYFRAATIVTAAEFSNANIANGSPLRSMGFGLNIPASGAVQGMMKVYLVNTTDAAYSKGNIWDTITSNMILVFDDTVDIASGASSYNMTFSNNFSYSGNNLYVAYDWEQLSAPISTALNYRANTTITSSIRRQASSVAPPATLTSTSSFRPELLWGIDKTDNDLEVSALFAKGKNPLAYGAPETIQVNVRNNGYLPANKMLSFNVSGANTFAATAMVSLPSEGDTVLTFSFTAANTGFNTITATVPSDAINSNDSIHWIQESTTNTFGYADTVTTNLGAVGYNTSSGLLLNQYELTGTAAVTDVAVRIGDNVGSVGNTVYAVVVDTAGNVVAQSSNLVIATGDLESWVNFSIPAPPTFTNEPFFVGLAQTANTTSGYFPLAYQIEDPTRSDAYFTAALSGSGLSPIAGFRFMIEAVVDTPPTCSVPVNLAAVAGCDTASLSWQSDSTAVSSTIQWGPTGFTPGTGTIITNVSNPYTLTGLALGTTYDFWVLDSCSSGSVSVYAGPYTFTTDTLPVVTASATVTTVTANDATVDFTTIGTGTSYTWDFGDSNSGTGASPTHNYLANGTYTVVVTATNNCGSSTDTIQVVITGIGLDEFGIGNISLYPNPNDGVFTVTGMNNFGDRATLEVINSIGMVIYAKTFNASSQQTLDIDLRGMAAGLYQLRIRNERGVGVKPFVIRN